MGTFKQIATSLWFWLFLFPTVISLSTGIYFAQVLHSVDAPQVLFGCFFWSMVAGYAVHSLFFYKPEKYKKKKFQRTENKDWYNEE